MCGRYVRKTPLQKLARLLGAFNALPELRASYNIAPTQPLLIARIGADGRRELALVRWSWVPHWAKSVEGTGPVTINARSETVDEKPAFRDAFKYRRCVVPADGFYEWDRSTQPRQPYYFHLAQQQPMWLAGLWEHWQDAHGNELETGVILTSRGHGNGWRKFHHRM
ncbi:MAG: SOS response-associated peptidase, partial [Phycisphaerales bacterium]|nr:SOS response-associated peptidase [Phycisphaerales bacterium]